MNRTGDAAHDKQVWEFENQLYNSGGNVGHQNQQQQHYTDQQQYATAAQQPRETITYGKYGYEKKVNQNDSW